MADLLDPEVEAILQEVAKDPDSILLRVDRPKELKAITRGADTLVTGKVGFSAAEKQLLEVHREEAAYLLRLAYYELAEEVAEERERGLFVPPQGKAVETLGDTVIRERLRRQRESLSTDSEIRDGIDAGLLLLADPDARLVDLAIASLRLAPSFSARSYVGSEHMIVEHWCSAEVVYRRLVAEATCANLRADCLEGLSTVLSQTGRPGESREEFRRASELAPGHPSVLSWLMVSIQTEHDEQAREALRLVDYYWPTPDREVKASLAAVRQQRAAGIWVFNQSSLPIVGAMRASAGETGRLILKTMAREVAE
jgi:hypothetical protein